MVFCRGKRAADVLPRPAAVVPGLLACKSTWGCCLVLQVIGQKPFSRQTVPHMLGRQQQQQHRQLDGQQIRPAGHYFESLGISA
jgi:hypothetical protein